MSDEVELLPCPFCGGAARTQDDGEGDAGCYVACQSVDCFAVVGEGYDLDAMPNHAFKWDDRVANAIAAWNRRSSDYKAALEAAREVVEAVAQHRSVGMARVREALAQINTLIGDSSGDNR